jgi:hypothetical protein
MKILVSKSQFFSRPTYLITLWTLVGSCFFVSCEKKSPTANVGNADSQAETEQVLFEKVSFNNDVMPILSDKCFHCHGPDAKNQESGYRLDTEENAKKALEGGGYGIFAGSLEKSELHQRIHSTGEDMMPPADSNRFLSDSERKILDTWISQGAEFSKHWAYIPVPDKVDLPEKTEWASNEIDRFVQEQFVERNLQPAEEVSKEKWLRRVTFDLTGLPPTLEALDAFAADDSPRAYEKVVDQLFKTDAYAERMTNEWMDVARYSDSYGFQTDKPRFVYPWRDWVISSFKKNQSYSEFITWQVAGDLLPNPTRDQILATTFNRLHPQKVEGGSVEEEFRVEYVADRLHTFGTAFLGLTMECSRCHDHKYDPLSTKSYYEMTSFFANIKEAGLYSFFNPKAVPPPTLLLTSTAEDKDLETKLFNVVKAEINLKKVQATERPAFENWLTTLNQTAKPAWGNLQAHHTFDNLSGDKYTNTANLKAPASSDPANKIVKAGKIGAAVQLSGDHPINTKLPRSNREQPLSYSFWIKPAELHERAVIYHQSKAWTDSASKGYELLLEDGKLSAAWIHFYPGNALRVKAEKPLPINKWTHVTITYDGSSQAKGVKIHINGTLTASEIIHDNLTKEIISRAGKSLAFGQRFRDSGFKNGQIDEFKAFSRNITALEVQELYDGKSLTALLAKTSQSLTSPEKDQLFQYYLSNHSGPYAAALKSLKDMRTKYNSTMDKTKEIMVMEELPEPKIAHILDRGLYSAKGEVVTANTPDYLPPFPEGVKKDRLGLTKWLLADNNPLTSRVTVNRYWQMIFSRGIVSSPEDFGSQGSRPTHARLLDWLARDFMESEWDVQRLLKRMVLSSTYRQSTITSPEMRLIDPKNIYLSRGNPARLTAEMIRDQVLATSGLLENKVGGASVRPYELAYSLKPMKPGKGNDLYRRSLYTWWQVTAPAPVMTTFDASKREVCRVSRDVTSSPLQALILLNGEEFIEASRMLGLKMITQFPKSKDQPAMIEAMFRTLTSRVPETYEREIFLNLYQDQLEYYKSAPKEAAELLKVGRAPKSETIGNATQAAATILANTISNLDEVLLKR